MYFSNCMQGEWLGGLSLVMPHPATVNLKLFICLYFSNLNPRTPMGGHFDPIIF